MFEDTVMSVVVVSVIVGLAAIWKWTSYGPHHDGTHQGLLGPEYTAPADPGAACCSRYRSPWSGGLAQRIGIA